MTCTILLNSKVDVTINWDTYFDLRKWPFDDGRLKENILIDKPKEHKIKKNLEKQSRCKKINLEPATRYCFGSYLFVFFSNFIQYHNYSLK